MTNDEAVRSLCDILKHHPFDCEGVYVYDVAGGTPQGVDEEARKMIDRNVSAVEALIELAHGDYKVWCDTISRRPEGGFEGGWCFGGFRIANAVVVVRKPLHAEDMQPNHPLPIDGYFMASVRDRVSTVLQCKSLEGARVPGGGAHAVMDLDKELSSVDTFVEMWRKTYGANLWFAVKNGTVVAKGCSRHAVEQEVLTTQIAPPVLYVPPANEEQTFNMYCADDI
jgi:hypothetical protein